MKKLWKALGITALAAVVPVRFKKDEATGKKTYQSLLNSVDVDPGKDDRHMNIGINIGHGLLTDAISRLVGIKKESQLFADDDPEAAVVAADLAETAAGQAAAAAAEAKNAAAEATKAADEAKAAAVEAAEPDFDPEF